MKFVYGGELAERVLRVRTRLVSALRDETEGLEGRDCFNVGLTATISAAVVLASAILPREKFLELVGQVWDEISSAPIGKANAKGDRSLS